MLSLLDLFEVRGAWLRRKECGVVCVWTWFVCCVPTIVRLFACSWDIFCVFGLETGSWFVSIGGAQAYVCALASSQSHAEWVSPGTSNKFYPSVHAAWPAGTIGNFVSVCLSQSTVHVHCIIALNIIMQEASVLLSLTAS